MKCEMLIENSLLILDAWVTLYALLCKWKLNITHNWNDLNVSIFENKKEKFPAYI